MVGGLVPRAEVLDYYQKIFFAAEKEADDELFSLAVGDVLDLCPAEIKETIYRGFEKDLIDPIMIDREEFDAALQEGWEENLSRLQDEISRHSLESVHDAMAWWAAFDAGPEFPASEWAFSQKTKQPVETEKKKKATKKKKRKTAKASQKKNRRR